MSMYWWRQARTMLLGACSTFSAEVGKINEGLRVSDCMHARTDMIRPRPLNWESRIYMPWNWTLWRKGNFWRQHQKPQVKGRGLDMMPEPSQALLVRSATFVIAFYVAKKGQDEATSSFWVWVAKSLRQDCTQALSAAWLPLPAPVHVTECNIDKRAARYRELMFFD